MSGISALSQLSALIISNAVSSGTLHTVQLGAQ